jgi:hypothetical protein
LLREGHALDAESGAGNATDGLHVSFAPPALGAPLRSTGRGDETVFIDSIPPPTRESAYRVLVLSTSRRRERVVVGGLILEIAPHQLLKLKPELLETIAGALLERCVTSVTGERTRS